MVLISAGFLLVWVWVSVWLSMLSTVTVLPLLIRIEPTLVVTFPRVSALVVDRTCCGIETVYRPPMTM